MATFQQIQDYWQQAGDFCQKKWEWMYDDIFAGDQWMMVVPGTIAIGLFFYVFYNLIFMFIDWLDWPFFRRYLIQEDRDKKFTKEQYWEAMKIVLFNAVIVDYIIIEGYYRVIDYRGFRSGRELPSFARVFLDLLAGTLCYEVVFFYLHYVLHHRWFYKPIHKSHHNWTAPISIISFYVHPLEHFLVNFFASLGAQMFFDTHVVSVWVFLALGFWVSVSSHGGYHLPWPGAISAEAHDYHHSAFIYNYGPLGILDRIHGTDKPFRHNKNLFQEHILFFTTGRINKHQEEAKKK